MKLKYDGIDDLVGNCPYVNIGEYAVEGQGLTDSYCMICLGTDYNKYLFYFDNGEVFRTEDKCIGNWRIASKFEETPDFIDSFDFRAYGFF